ncbi:MAG TPA: hypothetical protein VKU84_05500, partial [Stellaceae bacterium]|nr:hypothetical protein [Stellaceae bacterium]
IYAAYQYKPETAMEYVALFPGTAFWVLGLWASGFPSLVKRGPEGAGETGPPEAAEPYPTEP